MGSRVDNAIPQANSQTNSKSVIQRTENDRFVLPLTVDGIIMNSNYISKSGLVFCANFHGMFPTTTRYWDQLEGTCRNSTSKRSVSPGSR